MKEYNFTKLHNLYSIFGRSIVAVCMPKCCICVCCMLVLPFYQVHKRVLLSHSPFSKFFFIRKSTFMWIAYLRIHRYIQAYTTSGLLNLYQAVYMPTVLIWSSWPPCTRCAQPFQAGVSRGTDIHRLWQCSTCACCRGVRAADCGLRMEDTEETEQESSQKAIA